MQRISLKKSLVLLLTATIWGVAFVAQSVGMDYVGPFTFNAARSILGGLTLIPVIIIGERVKANRTGNGAEKGRVPCSREGQKNIATGWLLVWSYAVSGIEPSAAGNPIHLCRESGVFNRHVYRACTHRWNLFPEESRTSELDWCGPCGVWNVSTMYQARGRRNSSGRFAAYGMCTGVHRAYFGD